MQNLRGAQPWICGGATKQSFKADSFRRVRNWVVPADRIFGVASFSVMFYIKRRIEKWTSLHVLWNPPPPGPSDVMTSIASHSIAPASLFSRTIVESIKDQLKWILMSAAAFSHTIPFLPLWTDFEKYYPILSQRELLEVMRWSSRTQQTTFRSKMTAAAPLSLLDLWLQLRQMIFSWEISWRDDVEKGGSCQIFLSQ